MKVPLTVCDHIERAALVYGDRVGVVDEPDQPAPTLDKLTYRNLHERAGALSAGLDALGVPAGGRVAVVSQNAARLLTVLYGAPAWGRVAVPINFRLQADEVEYIVEHSGADVLLVDPELDESLAHVRARHRFVIGAESDDVLYRFDAEPRPWAASTRTRPPRSTTRAAPPLDPREWR